MKIAIFCLLLVPFLHGATIDQPDSPSIEPATTSPLQPQHGRTKRLLFDDDDYLDYLFGGRRRPSRRTIRLAQRLQQLGLSQAQLQTLLRNLENLQTMASIQQLLQLQNLQTQPTPQPALTG
ncbi:uncharacterized protein [Choristoneura fumiferana]|uniref:uncharacterized protein n=1 Tax=Choristoneura fumiferana TaxID=7141 RepID=UPI003D15C222